MNFRNRYVRAKAYVFFKQKCLMWAIKCLTFLLWNKFGDVLILRIILFLLFPSFVKQKIKLHGRAQRANTNILIYTFTNVKRWFQNEFINCERLIYVICWIKWMKNNWRNKSSTWLKAKASLMCALDVNK